MRGKRGKEEEREEKKECAWKGGKGERRKGEREG